MQRVRTFYLVMLIIICPLSVCLYGHEEIPHMINGSVPNIGELHTLVVFAAFKDDPQPTLPAWINDIFNPIINNSLQHYFRVQSSGLHILNGTVLQRWYYSDQYSNCSVDKQEFLFNILEKVDRDVDFRQFDHWTDSRIEQPDGNVDMIFFVIANSPWRSRALLEFNRYPYCFITDDTSATSGTIIIHNNGGVCQRYQESFENMMGIMAHEYTHRLGLHDLYDVTYFNFDPDIADYSAGIGNWCLMSEGYGVNGLYSLCSYSKAKLGWIPIIELSENTLNFKVEPNKMIKVQSKFFAEHEYFILSYRDHSNFYDRKLPPGLLIWHVDETQEWCKNENESHKLIDLECVDGLYSDKGYPGDNPDPIGGKDNLDFWAKYYPDYNAVKNGNRYDDTDPFDGIQFRSFTPYTNPNSNLYNGNVQDHASHLAITNIKPDGSCDIIMNYWQGVLKNDEYWTCECDYPYFLGSDIRVPPGIMLTLDPDVDIEHNGHAIISDGGEIIWKDPIVSTMGKPCEDITHKLSDNYPNPFNGETTIAYYVDSPANVTLTIYNVLGVVIDRITERRDQEGHYIIYWNANKNPQQNLSSGVYFYRLDLDMDNMDNKVIRSEIKKMMYVK